MGKGTYTEEMDKRGALLFVKIGRACKETIDQYREVLPEFNDQHPSKIYGHNAVFAEVARRIDPAFDSRGGGDSGASPRKGKRKGTKYTDQMDQRGALLFLKIGKACKETIDRYREALPEFNNEHPGWPVNHI